MRAATPALISLLNGGDRFIMADLYTFELIDGSTLRYSAAPTALSAPSYVTTLATTGANSGSVLGFPSTLGVQYGDSVYGQAQITQGSMVAAVAANTSVTLNQSISAPIGNAPLTFARMQLFALGPKLERTKTNVVTGIQVDELIVKVYPNDTDLVRSAPFLKALWTGEFDGALLTLERAFMPSYGDTSPGTIVLFAGRVGQIDVSRTMATINVKSHLELLNVNMPRRLLQPSCTHVFGGAMCGYDRVGGVSTLGVSTGIGQIIFAAGAGSTPFSITGVPVASGPYKLGTMTGLSGQNAGYSRTVDTFVSGAAVGVKLAFPFPVAVGDQFQILPGCDRSLATCGNIFHNQQLGGQGRFGGMPFIPTAETAV